jgi:hypothetical protein
MPNLPLEWLIPIVLIILWIVNSFLRGNDEEKAKKKPRASSEGDSSGSDRPTRRTTSDIDRFLDEVNRRRREAAERRQPQPAPRPKPAPPPPRKASPKPKVTAPPLTVKPAARPLERPVEPAPVLKTAEVVDVLPVATALPATSVLSSPAVSAVPKRTVSESAAETTSPVAERLAALLATPESLQTAFMLREVFGEPRCKQPRR